MEPGKLIKRNVRMAAFLSLWIVAVFFGLRASIRYSTTPGRAAQPPANWPVDAPFALDGRRPALLTFIHPQCPCSRATLEELARILAHAGRSADVRVFLYSPSVKPAEWRDASQITAAAPGITVIEDRDGIVARRFGVATSGQTLLYDPRGRLLFSGGLTGTRGHVGDNEGQAAVSAFLAGTPNGRRSAPVFGCSLISAGE